MSDSSITSRARLEEFCRQRVGARRLILASNRGPVEYHLTEDRQLQARRGSGGVVTALGALSQCIEVDWIASAMGEGDRLAAQRASGSPIKEPLIGENLYLNFIISPRQTYHKFYGIFCNPLLWFLQHYMWSTSRTPNIDHVVYDAWENGYKPVNQAFAEAIVAAAAQSDPSPIVLLNDYHLYLAAGYIREKRPDLVIQHFTHIPWPDPRYWQLLPRFMLLAILRGLCAADIVGLQTRRDVISFLRCCQSFLEEAKVNIEQQTVQIGPRRVRVQAYPISVDVPTLKQLVTSDAFKEYQGKLRPLLGEPTIVRVDRAEPSKNLLRGFKAFDTLLTRYPRFLGKVKLIAFIVPSRTQVKAYQRYSQETIEAIDEINRKYGTGAWHPIDYFYENNYLQAIAGMHLYDVLLVNAVIDGMNLVAKEGPVVNGQDGVLVLSETAGACEELGEYALTVAPADIEGTVQALYRALTMAPEERHQRAAGLKETIEKADLNNWLLHLLEDAVSLAEARSQSASAGNAPHRPPRPG
ncbi:MAG: trehalose-6-phosphate synthase [Chloroflexota bacterium]